VLLCWDDGYKSFLTHVLPLLRAYKFPAVLALVGNWMDTAEESQVLYGTNYVPREKFLSWDEVREIKASGLVEIASHSMNLHVGKLASPSGDRLPAAIAYGYDKSTGQYETEDQYLNRIRDDLEASSRLIAKETGDRPRVLVWPFGRYNDETVKVASQVGMEVTLTLDPEAGTVSDLSALGRFYPTLNPDTGAIRNDLELRTSTHLRRYVKVRMEDLREEEAGSEKNFGDLLERLHTLEPGGVILEPLRIEGDKSFALFPTKSLLQGEDRLLRLLWHSNRRGSVDSLLWLDDEILNAAGRADSIEGKNLFTQLGMAAPCNGVVLAGVSVATSGLDFSKNQSNTTKIDLLKTGPIERRKIRKQWLLDADIPDSFRNVLTHLETFQKRQPFLEVSLVLPAEAFPEISKEQFVFLLSGFDFLFVDFRSISSRALKGVLDKIQKSNLTRKYFTKLVPLLKFEDEKKRGERFLIDSFNTLQESGFINGAYDSDDFLHERPSPDSIRKVISTASFPVRPK